MYKTRQDIKKIKKYRDAVRAKYIDTRRDREYTHTFMQMVIL